MTPPLPKMARAGHSLLNLALPLLVLQGLVRAVAIIQIPQISVTPIQTNTPVLVGNDVTLSATLTNSQIIGFGPFLELYADTSCYDFKGVVSSYETFVAMPIPDVTTFDPSTATCQADPVLSTVRCRIVLYGCRYAVFPPLLIHLALSNSTTCMREFSILHVLKVRYETGCLMLKSKSLWCICTLFFATLYRRSFWIKQRRIALKPVKSVVR